MLTQNQVLAIELLGYLPDGYVVVCELCRANPIWHRTGAVLVDGVCVYMFDGTPWLRGAL